jgi:hypothetical protein
MKTKSFGIQVATAGLMAALGGVGCAGADGSQVQEQDEAVAETSQLVHSIDVGNGHTIEFYDFGEGQVGIKEQFAVGDKPLLDNDAALQTLTLEDMYRHVRPGSLVPAAIHAADAHAADTLSKPQVMRTKLPAFLAQPEVAKVESAASNCSADLFNDNWSAQWFVDNYAQLWLYNCGGDFVNVNHAENLTLAQAWAGGKYVWLWKGFNGDHNVSSSFVIYRNGFGLPANVPLASGSIAPRTVAQWTIRGGWNSQTNHADSRNSCGHAGYAQVWCGLL